MRPTTLHDLERLAADLPSIPDDRPGWLADLPSARDEGAAQFARYYRFFHELAKQRGPLRALEIGTYRGTSAAHLAWANVGGTVVTVDVDPNSAALCAALGIRNLTAITADAAEAIPRVACHAPFDVLFVDAQHDFDHCYGEYLCYRPMVAPGGIVFFDDLHIHPEMEAAWDAVADPKAELPSLHYTGFGACVADPDVAPTPWHEAVRRRAR